MGDFNIATSSLHALSTSAASQSSMEKHSPHTSPRLGRRSTTPSLMAVQNDLYAGGAPALSLPSSSSSSNNSSGGSNNNSGSSSTNCTQQQQQLQQQQQQLPQPSAPPAAAVISNGSGNGSINSTGNNSTQKTTNRMSAPLIGSSVINSTYGQKLPSKTDSGGGSGGSGDTASISSYAILQNLQDAVSSCSSSSTVASATPAAVAPPLPPRKSPGGETPVKPNGTPSSSKSIDNIQCSLDNVPPQTTAPPIPRM